MPRKMVNRIAELRVAYGRRHGRETLKQEELAKLLGMSRATLSKLENQGNARVTQEQIQIMVELFGLKSASELYTTIEVNDFEGDIKTQRKTPIKLAS